MKKMSILIMLVLTTIAETQYDSGTLTIDNIPEHQLWSQNVKFDSEFTVIPKVVLSIQHVEANQIIELYSRAADITSKGFILQIISSSQLSSVRVNYMGIQDDQLEVICQNFQTKKGLIKISISKQEPQVGIFVTGFSLQQNQEVNLNLDSIEKGQAIFQTKQQSLGLCLLVGDANAINQQTQITTTIDGHKLDFEVADIEETLNIPLENSILSFDDIMNKLMVSTESAKQEDKKLAETNEQPEEYLDIDSISIDSIGDNESDIQSLEIQFLKPTKEETDSHVQQLINSEKDHIQAVQQVVEKDVTEELQLELEELQAEKQTLAQVNQLKDSEVQDDIDSQFDIVPQTAEDLDMDALYKEFTLGNELADEIAGWTSATVVKQDIKQSLRQQQDVLPILKNDQNEISSVDVIDDSVLQDIRVEDDKPKQEEQQQQKDENLNDIPLFDVDVQVENFDTELEVKEVVQEDVTKEELIEDYKTFVAEENEKASQQYEQQHPLVEVKEEKEDSQDPQEQQEMPEDMEDELLQDSLKGIDFDLFFDDFYNPNDKQKQEPQQQPQQKPELKQEEKVAVKFEEAKAFKQPKDRYEDVMKDLKFPEKVESSQDEQELITQLKEKSIQLRKKLQDQYDAVPKLEEAKKQTEYSIHSINEQYPNINIDPEVEYEVENKYLDWQMSDSNNPALFLGEKIKKIGQDLTEDDLKNPRFSLLQMETKSELDIQKQINDFLGWDEASFFMVGQHLRRR